MPIFIVEKEVRKQNIVEFTDVAKKGEEVSEKKGERDFQRMRKEEVDRSAEKKILQSFQ